MFIAARIWNEILAKGKIRAVEQLLEASNATFKVGPVITGHGRLKGFRFNIVPTEDHFCKWCMWYTQISRSRSDFIFPSQEIGSRT